MGEILKWNKKKKELKTISITKRDTDNKNKNIIFSTNSTKLFLRNSFCIEPDFVGGKAHRLLKRLVDWIQLMILAFLYLLTKKTPKWLNLKLLISRKKYSNLIYYDDNEK